MITEFPPTVLEKKVLGALLEELKDRELLPLTLQNVFAILQRVASARRTLSEKVIPRLKEIFFAHQSGKGTVQERDSKKDAGLMVVLQNMNIVAENCSGKEFKDGESTIHYSFALVTDPSRHFAADSAWFGLVSPFPG